MLAYCKHNYQFIVILLIWLFAGIYAGPAVYVVVFLFLAILLYKEFYEESFLGLFYLMILSDNFHLGFASSLKPLILITLTAFFLIKRREFQPITKLYVPFIAFFGYSLLMLSQSETLMVSLQKNVSYILLFIMVPNFVMKIYQKRGAKFFRDLIYFNMLILISCFVLVVVDVDIAFSHGDRFRGLFGNPNGLGMYCVFVYLFYRVSGAFFPDLYSRVDKLMVMGLIFSAVLLSASRNAIVSILIFELFLQFYQLSPFIGSVILLIILLFFEAISTNIIDLVTAVGLSESARLESVETGSGRLVAWKFAWTEIQKNFVFGKGWAFDEYIFYKPENQAKLNLLNHQGGVHNVYLGFWLNTGIVGLVMFFSAFFFTFYKAAKHSIMAVPAMYSLMFLANFEPWLLASLNPYTIQLLIILTIIIYIEQEKPALQPALQSSDP